MIRLLLFIFLFYISGQTAEDYFQDRILFCLNDSQDTLNISYKDNIAHTNNEYLNHLLSEFGIVHLSRWLKINNYDLADEEINLRNIYRAIFNTDQSYEDLVDIISKFRALDIIVDAQLEEKYHLASQTNPYYSNDTYYNDQWIINKIMITPCIDDTYKDCRVR
ncbi:MAG: hypothetical protein P8Y99_05780 [Calditrichaceae bacterium]